MHDKTVLASAALLDWRVKNPAADATRLGAHLTSVRTAFDAQLSRLDQERPQAERLRRLMQITYATPDTAITGTQLTAMLGVVTGRDLAQVVLTRVQRLTGAQQGLDLDAAYAKARAGLWTAVHDRARTDAVFAAVWRAQLGAAAPGQPFSLDPAATTATLKVIPAVREQVDLDALVTKAQTGKTAFYTEVLRQFALLQAKYDNHNGQLVQQVKTMSLSESRPGSDTVAPPPEKVEAAKKAQASRQQAIDKVKGGLDFITGVAKYVDPGFGNKIAQYVETAYQVATTTNTLITAIGTLASATAIGAGTLGYVGAVIGAVVGLVQIFAGLFGGSSGADQAAQQQIMNALNAGFANINANLKTLHTTMNTRFDRVDQGLNLIFQTMQLKFGEVIELIKNVGANVREVHEQLLTLQSTVQDYNKALLDGISDSNKDEFLVAAGQYVDYPFYNNGATLPTYANHYVPAVSRFLAIANNTARNNNFAYQDLNQRDPRIALTAKGPAGAIDWLANHANASYGTSFAVSASPGNVPNADLWAQGARAYYLTALQNPAFAGQEGPAQNRASEIIDNGKLIRDRAAQFSTPAPGTGSRINPVFQKLVDEYLKRLGEFTKNVGGLARTTPVMDAGREFSLFDDANQALNPEQLAKLIDRPAESKGCGNPQLTGPTPAFVDGKSLPQAFQVGRYIEPRWRLDVCVDNPTWLRGHKSFLGRRTVNGVVYIRYQAKAMLEVEFRERVASPEYGPVLGRINHARKELRWCTWEEEEGRPEEPNCPLPALDRAMADPAPFTLRAAANVDGAGVAETTRLLSSRRAAFYDLVAHRTNVDGVGEAVELNKTVRLYQAYAQVGLPRATATDDQLHALLFGMHGLAANTPGLPILSAVYARAAQLERANNGNGPLRVELLDDAEAGRPPMDCAVFRRAGKDPISDCLLGVAGHRGDRINARIHYHFSGLVNGTQTETLPLVDEAITNLELARQYARTKYPAGVAPRSGG
ncbi:hypothetical protein [Crossiella sp. CA198]|uniref:hypothetical protein n=1 Tax=Crossiella sp. CA198 TaxID=3455607 RepID=UPI003F8D4E55